MTPIGPHLTAFLREYIPSWLTLTPAGELHGTPPATPQNFTLEIRVTDSVNAVATKDLLLHVR
jgi:hypothetical protein